MEIYNGDCWWLIHLIQVRGYGFMIRLVYVMLIMCVGVEIEIIMDMRAYGFKVNLFNVNMGYRHGHMFY